MKPSLHTPPQQPTAKSWLCARAGFSLIWMSILLTVGAIVMVSVLPGNEAGDYNAKTQADMKKLARVEEAMRGFMATNLRRPCPASGQYALNSQYFGKEAANPGLCYSGTPAVQLGPETSDTNCNNGTTGCIVSGVIPTRSLDLPDDFMFDSYGRRFTYVVDMRATANGSCLGLEGITPANNYTPNGTGGLVIKDIAGNTLDNTMYAYIQHGPSGYGAFPEQGSSAIGRMFSASTDTYEIANAGVDAACVSGKSDFSGCNPNSDFSNIRYRNSRVFPYTNSGSLDTGFDNITYYRNDIKNTCCLGPKCIPIGFRIDGSYPDVLGIGDVNGDGYPDLVLTGLWNRNFSSLPWVAVIFGTPTGWPIPPSGLNLSALNGTNGFYILLTAPDSINAIGVGDINGDGYADIVIGGQVNCCDIPDGYIVFGGPGGGPNYSYPYLPGNATTINVNNLNGYTTVAGSNSGNGTSGVKIKMGTAGGIFNGWGFGAQGIEIGKIDETGYPAIIEIGRTGGGIPDAGFVIFGKPTVCPGSPGCVGSNGPNGANDTWTNTTTIDATKLDGSTGSSVNPGFQFYSSDSNMLVSSNSYTSSNGATGDFDQDGYQDFVIGDAYDGVAGDHGVVTAGGGAVYIVYGRSRADWTSDFVTSPYNGNSAVVDLQQELTHGDTHGHVNRATQLYASYNPWGAGTGGSVFVGDLGNGVPDILVSGPYTEPIGVYGGSRWPETYNIYNIASGQGFYVTGLTPSGNPYGNFGSASAFDVGSTGSSNLDGKADLLVNIPQATALGRGQAGEVLVFYQPSGGWPNNIQYSNFHWDATDSFQIAGPFAGAGCGWNAITWAADVRPGDGGKPEIIVSCDTDNFGSSPTHVYGLYKNKGWLATIDLNNLN